MESMGHLIRKRSAKPSHMAASGLPTGMPLTLPSEFARERRSRSSTRPKLSPINSSLPQSGIRLGPDDALRRHAGLRIEGVLCAVGDELDPAHQPETMRSRARISRV